MALFSYLKFDCISSSVFKLRNVENEWNSKFEKKKININLKLNISSKEIFMIYINKKLIYKSLTPFGNKKNKEDIRVNFLKLYINNKNFISINKQSQIIKMWKHVKHVTKIIN